MLATLRARHQYPLAACGYTVILVLKRMDDERLDGAENLMTAAGASSRNHQQQHHQHWHAGCTLSILLTMTGQHCGSVGKDCVQRTEARKHPVVW